MLTIKEKESCWEFLKKTKLPIFIYGMGDGALKILSVFGQKGIPLAGFFASDEFVRGHSFERHLVHKLSEIESAVDEFVIVLAFAAGYKSLYDKVNEIAKKHILRAPDVPVAGEGLFDYEYFLENKEKFERVYESLADEKSRKTYENVINFKISGKIEYLNECTADRDEVYGSLLKLSENEVYIDLGAYNGDTSLEFAAAANNKYKHIYAFEPNPKNYKKLCKNTQTLHDFTAFNAAAWKEDTTLRFTKNEGRMSRNSASGEVEISALSADNAVPGRATLIKLDVEGSEREAILGARRHISGGASVECALYHRNEDMFALPLMLLEINPDYKLYVRHRLYIPAWETNLYAHI